MIKKIIFLIICSILLKSGAYAQTITLGYVDFPPYEFQENGKPSGILVEIVETLFRKAEIPLKLVYLPFKRAYESTKFGEIDGLFNFYKTDERLTFFDYSDFIIKNSLVFFTRKDSSLEFNTLDDLKGLEIGVMLGYTYGTEFDRSTIFTKNKANTHEMCFKRLVFARTNAYPCDKLVGIHVAMQHNYMSELKILPRPLKVMNGYIGFTKGKHEELIKKINLILKEMHENGEIDNAINSYLDKNL